VLFRSSLSNKGEVIIRSRLAPIAGTVCMDEIMVDVGHIPGVKAGDEVVLIGKQGKHEITAEHIAEKINTIPYEITCAITKRVPRIYLG
jgi:alanine racemase